LRRLVLVGHTDDVGTDASNTKLGRQRVEFIIDELERRGVERSLMEGRSAGEQLLPTRRTGESEDTWRKRARRVELVKVLQQ
jgi:outer membrane protein OmpA-like peptidoglycan-associated protein